MSTARSDKRRFPRFEVFHLAGSLKVPVEITVINLSLGGLALETNSYLHFGRAYTLKLEDDEYSFSLSGTVAWCSLKKTIKNEAGEVLPIYRAGLKFEALSSDRSRELWELIRSHALVEIEDSVLGRFKVELPTDTELGSSYDFAVRKISLSGMLIETDFVPEMGSSFELQLQLDRQRWDTRARVASIPRLGRQALGELTQVGVEFCDLEPNRFSELQSYIESRIRGGPAA